MGWTPENIEKLKELWGKDHTAGQIAEIIGGVTRNAVIGKAHRLNLSVKNFSKNSNFKKKTTPQVEQNKLTKGKRKFKFKSLIIEKDFEPENPKQLEELDDQTCKWPIGHPNEKDFYFCGRTSLKDFSYCKLHLLYNFQPKNKKENILDKDDEVPQFIEKKIKSA
tara:strand:+ start:2302 stop:2796 length:495 start_codon:yes stop_codon:yes gene_type:complete